MLKILEAFTVKLRFITLLWVKNTCSHRIPDIHDLSKYNKYKKAHLQYVLAQSIN